MVRLITTASQCAVCQRSGGDSSHIIIRLLHHLSEVPLWRLCDFSHRYASAVTYLLAYLLTRVLYIQCYFRLVFSQDRLERQLQSG